MVLWPFQSAASVRHDAGAPLGLLAQRAAMCGVALPFEGARHDDGRRARAVAAAVSGLVALCCGVLSRAGHDDDGRAVVGRVGRRRLGHRDRDRPCQYVPPLSLCPRKLAPPRSSAAGTRAPPPTSPDYMARSRRRRMCAYMRWRRHLSGAAERDAKSLPPLTLAEITAGAAERVSPLSAAQLWECLVPSVARVPRAASCAACACA